MMIARIGFLAGIGLIGLALLAALLYPLWQRNFSDQPSAAELAAVIASGNRLDDAQWASLAARARDGDAVAQNNLGVAIQRHRDPRAEAPAAHWYRLAAAQGQAQARYNLARSIPDRFDTDPEIVQEGIALLQANVALGDVPSMVALADRLSYVNRDAFVPDRAGLRRELLAQAAATGDPDYQLRAARALWNSVRGGADPMLVSEAFGYLVSALEAGDPRGAEMIGDIMANRNPALKPAIDASGLSRNPLDWFQRAGDMGLGTAQCRYGLEMFYTLRWSALEDETRFSLWLRQHLVTRGYRPEDLDRGIQWLGLCADLSRLPRTANPAFGSPALYASKVRPTWVSIANSPGHAALTLGVLYGYGIVVEPDRARATRDLLRARDDFGFEQAQAVLDRLALP